MKNTLLLKLFYCLTLLAPLCPQQSNAQGVMTTIVGDSVAGYSGDNGPSNLAKLNQPHDVCMDAAGNMYIADMGNHVVRKITKSTGIITTIAGNGTPGYLGDNGRGTAAMLTAPTYLALDNFGNLFISDGGDPAMSVMGSPVVRKLNLATGVITTAAGNGAVGFTGDGGQATAAELDLPQGICVDPAGNLYIVDWNSNVIRKVTKATGLISTIAGSASGTAGFSGNGGPALSALMTNPQAICITPNGDLYFSDMMGEYIRKVVAATGAMAAVSGNGGLFSGDGGPAITAGLGNVDGLCSDWHGDVYCCEWSCSCRKITVSTGIINILAGDPSIDGYNGDGGVATSIYMNWPAGLCVDPTTGNIIIADALNERIRNATQPGFITTRTNNVVTLPEARIFPNPTAGAFVVTTTDDQKLSTMDILNATGDVVFTTTLKENQTNVNLTTQPAGMYFIQISSSAGTTTQKVMIMK